jgi:DNA polymerase I-like protein with 3'-5' exonuclease and polymerase domains
MAPTHPPTFERYSPLNIVTTEEQLCEVAEVYSRSDFAFDTETVGDDRLDHLTNQVLWISLATHGRVDVIPLGHPNGEFLRWDKPLLATGRKRQEKGLELRDQDYSQVEAKWTPIFSDPPPQLRPSQVWKALKPAFLNPGTVKVAQNLKFDVKACHKHLGTVPAGPWWDTMIASWVTDPGLEKGLDKVLKRIFDHQMVKGVGKMVERHSFDEVATYAALDARWTWLLAHYQNTLLDERDVWDVFELEMDTLRVVVDSELQGVRFDIDSVFPLKESLEEKLTEDIQRVYDAAGQEFNLNSNADKQKILFGPKNAGGQGLRSRKKTASGNPSVDAETLKHLLPNPVAQSLLEYTDTKKLLSTYVTAYTGGEVERTTGGKTHLVQVPSLLKQGRIYASFNQTGAETGRFSSSQPNLQTIPNPQRSDIGKRIRNLFIPDEGHQFIVADFGQIEPRVIASLSGDERMIQAFLNGEDIYTAVADPLGETRKVGKELVLSIAYGIGPDTIAERLGVPVTKAKELMQQFNEEFPTIDKLRKKTINNARKANPPHVRTLHRRIRVLPDLNSQDPYRRARAERQAFNTICQGSAADLMKLAMVRVHKRLPLGAHIVLNVHDEIVVTCPGEAIDDGVKAVTEGMTGINELKVPLTIDLSVVDRWGDAK